MYKGLSQNTSVTVIPKKAKVSKESQKSYWKLLVMTVFAHQTEQATLSFPVFQIL